MKQSLEMERICNILKTLYLIPKGILRLCFILLNNVYCIGTYTIWMILLYPLRKLGYQDVYYKIEGKLFHWMLAMVAMWSWSAGYEKALTQCKNIFEMKEVQWQLAFPKSHFTSLPSFIKELETQKIPLCTAIKVANRCESLLFDAANVGSSISANKILNKFKNVIGKNDVFELLRDISLILSGQSNGTQIRMDLNPDMIAPLKFATITSVDVVRSFSAYKDILSVDNLEKHLIL
ncbi:hypothetical protein HHI36_010829 [Cryptolaemus montrouzieri]|uniref:Uncharacterized protein n=1 Tax=Cryptolaemus montrouzieri TaxID=559131 RepID=A0ABD2MK83_9CUCU